jgi:hypothetical protein
MRTIIAINWLMVISCYLADFDKATVAAHSVSQLP